MGDGMKKLVEHMAHGIAMRFFLTAGIAKRKGKWMATIGAGSHVSQHFKIMVDTCEYSVTRQPPGFSTAQTDGWDNILMSVCLFGKDFSDDQVTVTG
jgi:hypothetical protein